MNCYLIRTGEGLSFEVSIDDKVMKNLGHYMVDESHHLKIQLQYLIFLKITKIFDP